MQNQFGLAKNNFIYQALLSDQNYSQSQVLQSNQIKGNLDSVDRQVAGQLESTKIAGKAQVMAAQAQAGAMVASAHIQADSSTKNAILSAKTSLQLADVQRQTTLDSLNIDYQQKAALQAQGGVIDIAKIGATGAMQKDVQIAVNAAQNADTLAKSLTLGYQQYFSSHLLQTEANVAAIGATAGLTGPQQANAIKTLVDIGKVDNDAMASFVASLSHTNPAATGTAPNYADYVAMPGFGGAAGLDFYKGHTPGTSYPSAASSAVADMNKPFVPGLPVPA
jgi:hypothetical protein